MGDEAYKEIQASDIVCSFRLLALLSVSSFHPLAEPSVFQSLFRFCIILTIFLLLGLFLLI